MILLPIFLQVLFYRYFFFLLFFNLSLFLKDNKLLRTSFLSSLIFDFLNGNFLGFSILFLIFDYFFFSILNKFFLKTISLFFVFNLICVFLFSYLAYSLFSKFGSFLFITFFLKNLLLVIIFTIYYARART